jgi:ribosomal peptide maturation radical SAM protein 1
MTEISSRWRGLEQLQMAESLLTNGGSATDSRSVLLVIMPFLSLKRPGLGVATLKAELACAKVGCDVWYASFDFAEQIGIETYQRIAQVLPTHHLVGDWIFSPVLFPDTGSDDEEFFADVLAREPMYYNDTVHAQIKRARELAPAFIAACADRFDPDRYDIVGFSSTFQQNAASLALAQEIKRRHAHVTTMFGGANFEGEMGVELHRQLPFVDIVCSGEADTVLPVLVQRVRSGEALDDLPGVTFRRDGVTVVSTDSAQLIHDLDGLPYPDHTEFVERFRRSSAAQSIVPELTFETSRGCWWGQKHHCTFCGLNGMGMAYRSKSPSRAFDEVCHLIERYGISELFCTDNIVDMRYFAELFPRLRDAGVKLGLHYETKANLKKWQLRTLRELGTDWFQPGIESLNSHVLGLIDKGVKGIQNVQLLRWARELGFRVTWNVLCGFPGETAADYRAMAAVMRAIPHLAPPASFAQFRLDRFSPMSARPHEMGLTNVRPHPAYRHCYAFEEEVLSRIAYFFQYDSTISDDTIAAINDAWRVSQAWKQHHHESALIASVSDAFVLLQDTRYGFQPTAHLLIGVERAVYLAADRVGSRASIARDCGADWDAEQVYSAIDRLADLRLMLCEDDLCLSLATFCPPLEDGAELPVSLQNRVVRAS